MVREPHNTKSVTRPATRPLSDIWSMPDGGQPSPDDCREITANIQGFFGMLERWRQDRQALPLAEQATASTPTLLTMRCDSGGSTRRVNAKLIDIGGIATGLNGRPCFTPMWSTAPTDTPARKRRAKNGRK